ncbi:MAG: response regulator, partial [Gammaproteobacteria bacterium]|nr:response regulator [Gammaproteobacteria bacterium]
MTVQAEIYDMKVKPKVLIVDDEEHNVELYSLFLADEFAIETAVTGEEALQKIAVFEPDVILLDIMLPDISGYDICKKLRENDQLRLVKVLFVSGLVELDDRLHGYAVGADDYVTKPVNADELLAKVKVYSRLRKIEEIDEYKNTFMSLISHETSTPLNAIIGFSG